MSSERLKSDIVPGVGPVPDERRADYVERDPQEDAATESITSPEHNHIEESAGRPSDGDIHLRIPAFPQLYELSNGESAQD